MTSKIPSAEQLSWLLYETDPMNTCCRENACYDEYARVAHSLVELLSAGEPLHVALRQALYDWFGRELLTRANLEETLEALRTALEGERGE